MGGWDAAQGVRDGWLRGSGPTVAAMIEIAACEVVALCHVPSLPEEATIPVLECGVIVELNERRGPIPRRGVC